MSPVRSTELVPSRMDAPARLPSRERVILWAGILSVTAVSWLVLAWMPMPSASISGGVGGMTAAMGAGSRCLVASRRWAHFRDVDGDDGGDDAAERGPDDRDA